MIELLLAAFVHLTVLSIVSIIIRPMKNMDSLHYRINVKIVFGAVSVLLIAFIDYAMNRNYILTIGLGFVLSLLLSIIISFIDSFLGGDVNHEYRQQEGIRTHHFYRMIFNVITVSLIILSLIVFKLSFNDYLHEMGTFQFHLWIFIVSLKGIAIYLERKDTTLYITTVGDGTSLFLTEFDEFPIFKIEKTLPVLPIRYIEKKFPVIESPRFVGIVNVTDTHSRYVLYVFESNDKVNLTFFPRIHLPDSYIDNLFHAYIRDITRERRITYKKRFVSRVRVKNNQIISAHVKYK